MNALQGKTVVLGITGGIAAYKSADLTSRLTKLGAQVRVIMTKSACEFIAPMTLEVLSGARAVTDLFDRDFPWEVEHISLAKAADVFAVVPATANVIAKLAHGIADDMLTTTALATKAPLLIAPAMNTAMLENEVTQANIETLRGRGAVIVSSAAGRLACGDVGAGKLADVDTIVDAIVDVLTPKDLAGKRVLITAGPTREALDPVRFLSNHSTGKMGYALAARAAKRGAAVTLVSGPVALATPTGVTRVDVTSAQDMYDAVLARADAQDMIIKAAAVADYRPTQVAAQKIKKSGDTPSVSLTRNPDILEALGARKRAGQMLCGFAMETENLLQNAGDKLRRKHCDMLVANNLREPGAGFGHDTNRVTLLFADGTSETLDLMEKSAVADVILNRLLSLA